MAKRSEIYGNDGVRDDKSQVFLYRHPDFAVYAQRNVYPKTYPFTVTDHWHDEVEFIYVYSGSLNYYVEGNCITLHGGQGLFINSRKVHVGKPNSNESVDYYFAILHPMLLCASKYVDETFVEPVIQNPSLPYIIFDESNSEWEKELLSDVASISDAHSSVLASRSRLHSRYSLVSSMMSSPGPGAARTFSISFILTSR